MVGDLGLFHSGTPSLLSNVLAIHFPSQLTRKIAAEAPVLGAVEIKPAARPVLVI
jgi:hypothetical protein